MAEVDLSGVKEWPYIDRIQLSSTANNGTRVILPAWCQTYYVRHIATAGRVKVLASVAHDDAITDDYETVSANTTTPFPGPAARANELAADVVRNLATNLAGASSAWVEIRIL